MKSNSCKATCRSLLLCGLVILTSSDLIAEPIRVASWNLGWHVAQAEVPNWIIQCGKSYLRKTEADSSDTGLICDGPDRTFFAICSLTSNGLCGGQ